MVSVWNSRFSISREMYSTISTYKASKYASKQQQQNKIFLEVTYPLLLLYFCFVYSKTSVCTQSPFLAFYSLFNPLQSGPCIHYSTDATPFMVANHLHVAKSRAPALSSLMWLFSGVHVLLVFLLPFWLFLSMFFATSSIGPHMSQCFQAQPGGFFSFFTFHLTNFTQYHDFKYPLQSDDYLKKFISNYSPGF